MKTVLNRFRRFLLTEGALEKEATSISREIISHFKKLVEAGTLHQSRVNYHWIEPEVPESLQDVADVNSIQVKVLVPKPYSGPHASRPTKPVEIRAGFGTVRRHPRTLFVLLQVNTELAPTPEDLKRSISQWLPTLKELVRHELEHARQHTKQDKNIPGTEEYEGAHHGKGPDNTRQEALEYFLSPEEKEAYVAGLYKKAKMKKEAFIDVLMDWISSHRFQTLMIDQEEGDLDDAEVQQGFAQIEKDYLDYARTRFPKAVFQSE